MSFVNSGEGNTRIKYLKKWGLDDAAIQHLPLRKQNADYVQTMLTEAQNGSGAPECMMAVLPCVISYSWIFKQMVARTPSVLEGITQVFLLRNTRVKTWNLKIFLL